MCISSNRCSQPFEYHHDPNGGHMSVTLTLLFLLLPDSWNSATIYCFVQFSPHRCGIRLICRVKLWIELHHLVMVINLGVPTHTRRVPLYLSRVSYSPQVTRSYSTTFLPPCLIFFHRVKMGTDEAKAPLLLSLDLKVINNVFNT